MDQQHRSWATLHITPEPPYEVHQYGLRELWDEVETAYRWWTDIDEPTVNAWTFTITPNGHQIELRARHVL